MPRQQPPPPPGARDRAATSAAKRSKALSGVGATFAAGSLVAGLGGAPLEVVVALVGGAVLSVLAAGRARRSTGS